MRSIKVLLEDKINNQMSNLVDPEDTEVLDVLLEEQEVKVRRISLQVNNNYLLILYYGIFMEL